LAAGEGSIQNFAATCRLRLPSKLADIQLAATVLDASTVPPSSTAASTSSYVANANGRSCDTAKLARFLSELSPEVSGSFDTACLVRDNCKSSEAVPQIPRQIKQDLQGIAAPASYKHCSKITPAAGQTSSSIHG